MKYFTILFFVLIVVSCSSKKNESPNSINEKETFTIEKIADKNNLLSTSTKESSAIEKNEASIDNDKIPVKKNSSNNDQEVKTMIEAIGEHDLSLEIGGSTYSETNNFEIEGDYLVFNSKSITSSAPGIGCSGSSSLFKFKIINDNQTSFEYKNLELQKLNIEYEVTGGLYYATGKDPGIGYIKGKLVNGAWEIDIDLKIKKIDRNSINEEGDLVPVQMKEIFNKI